MVSRTDYFRIVINATFIAFGPIMFIMGLYMLCFYIQFDPISDPILWQMPCLFMILGIFTIIISICSCVQMATENMCTAIVYFIGVVLLVTLLIGSGAFWVHVVPSYPGFINNTFDRAYDSYDDYKSHQTWVYLQTELKCCGLNGPDDFKSKNLDVPSECCRNKTTKVCGPEDVILDGCLQAFLYRVYLDRYMLGTLAIIAGSLMLLMLVASLFICFDDDKDDNDFCYMDDSYPDCYTRTICPTEVREPPHKTSPSNDREVPHVPIVVVEKTPAPVGAAQSVPLQTESMLINESPQVMHNRVPSRVINRVGQRHFTPIIKCRRCSHRAQCKIRQQIAAEQCYRMSPSSVTPLTNGQYICERLPNGKTICRATKL